MKSELYRQIAARLGQPDTFALGVDVGDWVNVMDGSSIVGYGPIIWLSNQIAVVQSREGEMKAKPSSLKLVRKGSPGQARRAGFPVWDKRTAKRPGHKAEMATWKYAERRIGGKRVKDYTANINGTIYMIDMTKDGKQDVATLYLWDAFSGFSFLAKGTLPEMQAKAVHYANEAAKLREALERQKKRTKR